MAAVAAVAKDEAATASARVDAAAMAVAANRAANARRLESAEGQQPRAAEGGRQGDGEQRRGERGEGRGDRGAAREPRGPW